MFSSLRSFQAGGLRAALGALLMAACGASQAGVALTWDLVDWQLRATPDQTIELRAMVFNEASASEHLLGSRFVGVYGEGIEGVYDFVDPHVSVADQFALMDLAPGQAMSFVLGRFAPVGGRVAAGAYGGGSFSLAFRDARGSEVSWMPERTLTIHVTEGSPEQALPEPASLALTASCLGALALQRRRRAKGASPQPH